MFINVIFQEFFWVGVLFGDYLQFGKFQGEGVEGVSFWFLAHGVIK
jgi:hypothetical protein